MNNTVQIGAHAVMSDVSRHGFGICQPKASPPHESWSCSIGTGAECLSLRVPCGVQAKWHEVAQAYAVSAGHLKVRPVGLGRCSGAQLHAQLLDRLRRAAKRRRHVSWRHQPPIRFARAQRRAGMSRRTGAQKVRAVQDAGTTPPAAAKPHEHNHAGSAHVRHNLRMPKQTAYSKQTFNGDKESASSA